MIIEFWILVGVLVISLGVGLFFIMKEKLPRHHATKLPNGDSVRNRAVSRVENGLEGLNIVLEEARLLKCAMEKVIIGQEGLINALLLGLFSGRHVLIQSLPGMAKTSAVKALSQLTGLEFGRIQGTPDLLPSDIIGIEMVTGYQLPVTTSEKKEAIGNNDSMTSWQHGSMAAIKKGPIFANILLFDEINRTTPKVQSAFIQAMEEKQVTIGHETLDLPWPFVVFATCNPLGSKGVYDLPEAQLDRFGLSIVLDYPKNERDILSETATSHQPPLISSAYKINFEATYKAIRNIIISEEIIDYIAGIIQKTRALPDIISIGASPRAGKDLVWLAKTAAYLAGKKTVEQSDVDLLIESVLSHRLVWKKGKGMVNFL